MSGKMDRTISFEGKLEPGAYEKIMEASDHLPTYTEGRILPTLPTQNMNRSALEQIVGQGIGRASVAWEETPKGVFDSTTCKQLLDEIMAAVEQHVNHEISENKRRTLAKEVMAAREVGPVEVKPVGDVISDAESTTTYDEDTLRKVYQALREGGIVEHQMAVDAVNRMQNSGILFRERA